MKYADVLYSGAPIAPAGLPGGFSLKGFRVVPLLSAGATVADVAAAYASLVVRVSRSSQSRAISGIDPYAVVDDVAVPGPDWTRSPGFNALLIQSGQAGVTYRVWWAEDCLEMVDAGTSPFLNGFTGAPTPASLTPTTTAVGPAGTTTQAQSSTANIPSLATDGVAVPAGAKGAYAVLSGAVGQSVTFAVLVWWRYNATLARWIETGVQESPALARRDVMGVEQQLGVSGGSERVFVEARSCTLSAAGNMTVSLVVG